MNESRAPGTKAARQALIVSLLQAADVRSQVELAQRLESSGFAVTQGTLSRDLVDVGAVRVRAKDGGLAYALVDNDGGGDTQAATHKLTKLTQELLLSAEGSANIAVLRTPAGAAQYFASAVDRAAWDDVLGTIAGDDTVMVVTRDPAGGAAMADALLALAQEGNHGRRHE
ncbi:MAG: arginine repressor [Propionibacteriaceae bacterium]|nr:arginine repressor [Micropruina sp.]HBX82897.1 arginine repressor [Propionibacteriaceae bacterium]HBY24729.1 arginine repressor [Propionibacteriaceae bacterium]